MNKSKKIFNDDDLYNKFRKNQNKNEDKKVSNNNNSNIFNNYILKNFYRKEEGKNDNSSEDINLKMKNQSHIPVIIQFKPHENNQLFSNISNPNNFNTSKQINKSNSYFKEKISINPTNKINGKILYNVTNNTCKINKSLIPFIGKNKRVFKSKIYLNLENYKQDKY